jgi:hypothetical protein
VATKLLAFAVAATAVSIAILLLREEPRRTIGRIPDQPPISVVVQWPEEGNSFWQLQWRLWQTWRSEDRLENGANGLYEVDGHDIGSGTVNIFLFTYDPDATVRRVVALHEEGRLPAGFKIAVAEYNHDRTDWTYKPAYPPGLERFQLMERR